MTLDHNETELGAALDQLADLRDRLDRSLVAEESARAAKHAEANRSQKLLAASEAAVRELIAVGANDAAARVQAMIGAAMGGGK